MPAPYSVDLRKKIIESYKTENITQADLAQRFKISESSVKRYLVLDRKKSDLTPKTEGKGRPRSIDESGDALLKEIIEANPTITLADLSKAFYKKSKIKVGRSVLSRACQRIEMHHKKLSPYAAEQERDDVKKNAKRTGKKLR
jgi:transposase